MSSPTSCLLTSELDLMPSGAEANHIFYISQTSGLKLIYHRAALSSTALQQTYHPEATKALLLFDALQLRFVPHILPQPRNVFFF